MRPPQGADGESERREKADRMAGEIFSPQQADFLGRDGGQHPSQQRQPGQQAGGGEFFDKTLKQPAVRIYPAAMGAYWMEVEGVRQSLTSSRVPVSRAG